MADECADIGWSLDETKSCYDVQTPLIAVPNKINDWALMDITTR